MLPLPSGGPWVLLVWITRSRISDWPVKPSWPGTKHGNAVALCMYVACVSKWERQKKWAAKRRKKKMWVPAESRKRDFIPAGQWVVYLCEQVRSQCLLTLQSYCCTVRLREYTCDCEGELWVSFDTWNPNKQLRPARTETRAINSTDIWASGSVYRLIIQHATKAYTHRRILTWALWQQSVQFHTLSQNLIIFLQRYFDFELQWYKKMRTNPMWNPVWNEMTCFRPWRRLCEG